MTTSNVPSLLGLMEQRRWKLSEAVIPPSASLREALAAIDRTAFEVVFVGSSDLKIQGTLSDGDVRRAILGGAPLDEPHQVGRSMQPRFAFVGPEVSRAEVLDLMRARGVAQIPVLDSEGAMVGLHLLRDFIGPLERSNAAVVMVGGQGLRLRPFTETVPKPMLTVAGRPILERIVLHLSSHGIRNVFLAINYLGHVIEDHFGDGSRFGCRIEYLREKRPLGTAGALSLLPRRWRAPGGDPVLVMNGDLLTQANIGEVLRFHESETNEVTVCLRPYAWEIPFGVARVEGTRLMAMEEKPSHKALINTGIYVISTNAIQKVQKNREIPMTSLIDECLSRGAPVGAYVLEEEWMDIGRHDELRRARGHE